MRHGQLLQPANPPRVSLPPWVFLAGVTSRARGLLSAEWWLSVPWHCPFQHVLCKVAALVCVKEEEGIWWKGCGGCAGRAGGGTHCFHACAPSVGAGGGAGFRAVASPGGREQYAQRRSRFGQEEPLAAAGTVFFSTSIRVVS